MSEQDERVKIAVNVADGRASVGASEGFFAKLFHSQWARARITAAAAEEIARKIEQGLPLDPRDQFFFVSLFEKDIKRHANTIAVAEKAREFLAPSAAPPARQLSPAPGAQHQPEPHPDRERWWSRVQRDTEDATDDDVRDLYARVLAGEYTAPGSFSLRTLGSAPGLMGGAAAAIAA